MYRDWVYRVLLGLFTAMSFFLMIAVLFPSWVFAESSSVPAIPDLTGFWEAIGAQHWPLAVGIGLTVVVWVCRSLVIKKISKRALPWVSVSVAVVGMVSTRMIQAIGNNVPWWHGMVEGILEGVTVGLTSLGYWDVKQSVNK